MKKISIVIPVYNVEKYIIECLDSVVNQTYKNLQIILVDDGSTDNSGIICDEYAKIDDRITVVHQFNQGAGAAKNTGLKLIQGEYFSLIDSDDFLELDYYEKMITSIIKNNADIVQSLFSNVFIKNKYKRDYHFYLGKDRIITSERFLLEMLFDWKYAVFWNKLFKTSLLNDSIRFPVGRKIDDEFFTYKLVCNSKRIININNSLYNYRMRSSSVMGDSASERLIIDRVDCFFERISIIKEAFPKLTDDYILHLYSYIKNLKIDKMSVEMREYLNNKLSNIEAPKVSVPKKIKQKLLFSKYVPNNNVFSISKEEYFE